MGSIARADSDAIGAAYEAATQEARDLCLFGASSLVVGSALFRGDDRLEDALAGVKRGTLA